MILPAKWRKAVYVVVVVATVAVLAFGLVTQEQISAGVETATQVVAGLAALLALFNVSDA